eukprot:Gb_19525 [translate_table: standard]
MKVYTMALQIWTFELWWIGYVKEK